MNPAKKNAARPGRVKAAYATASSSNHSTQAKRIVVVEKNAFEEIRIGVNEYIGNDYIDVRVFSIREPLVSTNGGWLV